MTDSERAVLWFRRDLRLHDHPALAAASAGGPVIALFVLDDTLLATAGAGRTAYLLRTLRALDADLRRHGGALTVRHGRPEQVVPAVVTEARAGSVHISADFAPYGALRDERVSEALGPVPLVATGSPYAISPHRVRKGDGDPFKVFTPFYRAWLAHGWRPPAASDPRAVDWRPLATDPVPPDPALDGELAEALPEAGEQAALSAWADFRHSVLASYAQDRDRPDLDRTSRMSPFLKFGAIHPRTLLADLGPSDEAFRRQLAWREFYAAVLHHWPASGHGYFRPQLARMAYDEGPEADRLFEAWAHGRTGFPIVDAGMRQLRASGWMHNRVRLITASFLVKDLHLEWTRGAAVFMRLLVDADLASNQHGWQWTAGTGTDAAPYFRIFNPVSQGRRFDPDGDYIRRWVPELAGLTAGETHEPWSRPEGPPRGYPPPVVDHHEERAESLARYAAVTGRG